MDENNVELIPENEKIPSGPIHWYIVHTYSGHENKVKSSIEMAVENRNLHDKIFEVHIPMDETIEVEDGKRRVIKRKTFPGYVFVKMIKDDETWGVIRYIRGVTGFVGNENDPTPLTDAEVIKLGIEDIQIKLNVDVGETVRVLSGPLENFTGVVKEIMADKQKVKVDVYMFGRSMMVELKFNQVQKMA